MRDRLYESQQKGGAALAYPSTSDDTARDINANEVLFTVKTSAAGATASSNSASNGSYGSAGGKRVPSVLSSLNGFVAQLAVGTVAKLEQARLALKPAEWERLHMLLTRQSLRLAGISVVGYSFSSATSQHQTGLTVARAGVFALRSHTSDVVPGQRIVARPPTLTEAQAMMKHGVGEGKGLRKITLVTEPASSRAVADNLVSLLQYDVRFGNSAVDHGSATAEAAASGLLGGQVKSSALTNFAPVSVALQQVALTFGLMFLNEYLHSVADATPAANPVKRIAALTGGAPEHTVGALAVALGVVGTADAALDPLFKQRDNRAAPIAGLAEAAQGAASLRTRQNVRMGFLEAMLLGGSSYSSQQGTFGAGAGASLPSIDATTQQALETQTGGRLLIAQQNALRAFVAATDDYISQEKEWELGPAQEGGLKNGECVVDVSGRK
jgi:hypothetical protein